MHLSECKVYTVLNITDIMAKIPMTPPVILFVCIVEANETLVEINTDPFETASC